jgi:hypothetical protein
MNSTEKSAPHAISILMAASFCEQYRALQVPPTVSVGDLTLCVSVSASVQAHAATVSAGV